LPPGGPTTFLSDMLHRRITTLALLATTALLPATAIAKDGDVRRAGSCTGATSSKIKLSPEDGRIEVEFEVDQNRNGVQWRVVLRANGTRFATAHKTTRGRSGSFELRRLADDTQGADRITARATSPSGGVCRASATISDSASNDNDDD
jgi:hypothetical protein